MKSTPPQIVLFFPLFSFCWLPLMLSSVFVSTSLSRCVQLLLSYWFDYYDDDDADESANGGHDDTKYGDGGSSSGAARGGSGGDGSGANRSGVRARTRHGLSVAKSNLAEFLPGSAEEAEEALKVLYY